MNLSEPFIHRPVATTLLMAALAFVGLVAFPFLPVAPLPQVDFPTIQVTANFQGASAETMASSVAAPLERQFAQIPGVTQLTSLSALGATTIVIQFDLNRNIDSAGQDVQAAITVASKTLPQDMSTPPSYKKVNPADSPIIMFSVRSDTMPLTIVDDYADLFLAQQISQVPGVAQVSIFGDKTPAIRIQVDPAKLAASGVTLEEIRSTLVTSTSNAAKGTVNTDKLSFTIAANDQITSAEQFNDVILAYRNGAPIRVRDVGQAVPEAVDRTVAAYQNNKPGVILAVFKQPGANVIETVDQIKAELPQLTARIPPAVEVKTILDRTTTIRASVADVEFTLALTIALVVLVILLFLRNFWATVIPSITVPLALLGSCAAMYLLNFSLDNLSLMALTIAVGFVVDDAIVVVENIYRHIEHGSPPFEAAIKGSREIGFTVLSISLSLIAVFIPLLLMGGIIGRLFREFALTVTASIAVSALVSLTLAPMLCSRFMHRESGEHGRIYRAIEAGFNAMLSFYRRTLDIVLRHQAITLGVFFATMALTVVMTIVIPKGFFPIQDTGMISGFAEAAQDTAPEQMMRIIREFGDVILRDPDVAGFGSFTGSSGGAQTANTGRFFIVLKPRDDRALTSSQIIDRLRPQLAKVQGATLFLQPTQDITVGGRISRASFQYTLQDSSVAELNEWSAEAAGEDASAAADRRRVERSLGERAAAQGHHQSRPGVALRHLAADDRRHAQRRVRPAPDHAVFHAAQDLLDHSRDPAGAAARPRLARPSLRQIAADRGRRAALHAGRGQHRQGGAAFDRAPGPVPRGHAHFNLRPGVALGQAVDAINGGRARNRHAVLGDRDLPGQRAGVPVLARERAGADRSRSHRRLHHPRNPLRELHPPADHPVHAAVGRYRRVAGAPVRPHGPLGHRHHRNHSADRHRQEERHHARRLRHHRRARPSYAADRRRSARPACCAFVRS